MVFAIAQFILENQQKHNYQSSTIWFYRKVILKKKISRSLHWQSNIFKGLLPSITKII